MEYSTRSSLLILACYREPAYYCDVDLPIVLLVSSFGKIHNLSPKMCDTVYFDAMDSAVRG
jgi:hypothetical protein